MQDNYPDSCSGDVSLNYFMNSTEVLDKVKDLTDKIDDLENANRMKELRIKNLQSDNETLTIKAKKLLRCNRNLKQQLDDEKFLYEKDIKYYQNEIRNCQKKCVTSTSKLNLRKQRELERACDSLQEENKQLEEELGEQNEIMYNLYIKYQRIKDSRDDLKQKLNQLFQNYLRVLTEMMEKLDEAREEFNSIVSNKFQHLPLNKIQFLQVVKKNRKLTYENAVHKLHIHKLNQSLERMKSEKQIFKIINENKSSIDIINAHNPHNQLSSDVQANTPSNKYIENEPPSDVCTNSGQSVRETLESSTFQQAQFCENCREYISTSITSSARSKTCDDSNAADESSGS